jgi:hypothetical protein
MVSSFLEEARMSIGATVGAAKRIGGCPTAVRVGLVDGGERGGCAHRLGPPGKSGLPERVRVHLGEIEGGL